ncbi:hypothetical protein NVP2275O_150 [Vibrio phage 2.275.O._10N.286.54.E11]|nr:hypothetical protein NVP2275O_150 [Vibrio phage 2.275.O._10N.286.54.E11]
MKNATNNTVKTIPAHYCALVAPTKEVAPTKVHKTAKATRDLKNKAVRELLVVKNNATKTAWVSSKYAYKNASLDLIVAKIQKRANNRCEAVANTYSLILQGAIVLERAEILSADSTALTLDKWNELVAEGYTVAGRPPKGCTAKNVEVKEEEPLTEEQIDAKISALIARRELLVK